MQATLLRVILLWVQIMRVASEALLSVTVRNTESAAGERLIFKLSATILQFDYGFKLHISVSLSYKV